MPTFTHDPRRVHPPSPPAGIDERTVTPVIAEHTGPFTQQSYMNGPVLVVMVLGATGDPHQLTWIGVSRSKQGQGYARAMLARVMADLDKDGMPCTVIIRNYEPGTDPQRLVGLLEGFGFVPGAPGEFGEPQLRREPAPL